MNDNDTLLILKVLSTMLWERISESMPSGHPYILLHDAIGQRISHLEIKGKERP